MSVGVSTEYDNVENNENVPINIHWPINDQKNYSESQEIFSDDDHHRNNVSYNSPRVSAKNDTVNSSVFSLKTPILCARAIEETPGHPAVPKTPVDLLPFIKKTSILWTSDMETPENKISDKPGSCNKTVNSIDINNKTPKRPNTPPQENMEINQTDITSPVLGGKKRAKRKAKRRLLHNINLDLDDRQSNTSSDKVPSETTSSASSEVAFDTHKEVNTCAIKENNNLHDIEPKENKMLEEAVNVDKNSNTSTQDFFSNASFSSIDKLCYTAIQDEKVKPKTNLDHLQNNTNHVNVENIEDNKLKNVSNDVIEKVAAIKKNQKLLRRSTDISNIVIPKEVFSKSVMELELADAKFSQEKKLVTNKPTTLELMSFSKLSSLDNDVTPSSKSSSIRKNGLNPTICNVPGKVGNNQSIDSRDRSRKSECTHLSEFSAFAINKIASVNGSNNSNIIKKESFEKDVKVCNDEKSRGSNDCQNTGRVLTTKVRNIPNSKDKILSSTRIYQDIDKEISDETACLGLKQKQELSKKSQTNFRRQTSKEDKKTESTKLHQDLEPQEFLESKLSPVDFEINDLGFSTGRGKGISINKEKESIYLKIYNELSDDTDLSEVKKPNVMKPIIKQSSKSNVNNSKPKNSDPVIASNDFATARGGNIAISEEKENHYLNIYNELSDDTDFSATKQPKVIKPIVKQTIRNSVSVKTEVSITRVSNNGFATARGGDIAISNEKENQYLKFYNELNDINEDALLNIKTNKQSKLGLSGKPEDKAVLIFNKKNNVKPKLKAFSEIPATKSSNNGFSTASGGQISISNEKESYYLKIYNELSDGIPGNTLENKLNEKPFTVLNQIKTEVIDIKKEQDDNIKEVLEEFGDLTEFFSPPHQTNNPKNTIEDSCFVVPSSSNILKKIEQPMDVPAITTISSCIKKEVCDDKAVVSSSENVQSSSLEANQQINYMLNDKPSKNPIGLLKRKLADCDVKRTGRCRSFGGFPANGEGVTAVKLNKSDPHNESSVNQPLQKGLSISQCFDAHSDSWLSKVEISYLNGSKIDSPNVRKQKKVTPNENFTVTSSSKPKVFEDCSGFTAEKSLESFRTYSTFKTFLRKQQMKCDNCIGLDLEVGHSITITNQTLLKRPLFLQYESGVDMKRGLKQSNYVLIETAPKKIESKKVMTNVTVLEKGKRKHLDTDSDTPLTSVKKPRVGSELQGRKLFSDESDNEEGKDTEKDSNNPLQSMEIQESTIQAEEEEEVDLSEERMSAILQQEKIIRNKKRMKIKPTMGSLLTERLENGKNRTSWSQLVGNSVPTPCSIEEIKQNNFDVQILEITASNATCYTFLSSNVIGKKKIVSLDVSDGALLIFDKNGQAGVSEFAQAFLAMPGVDPKLLPAGWVENHYKWIVWKLAAMDRIRFDSIQLLKNLTPQRVMSELKYRYDREIDKAQRPALRRILEKDDVPSRRMVLCISSIKECAVAEEAEKEVRTVLGLPRWKIEATDGWYDIPLTVDSAMADYIATGKIKEGTKIITYGAELMECERGFFPLEKPPNVSLKIHTNCTRRAKWDMKLGYQKISRPLPVKLRDIISAGGMVGEITAAAARVYPILYREKTTDGKSIYRNARCEEKAAIAHERAIEKKLDTMYAEAEKKFGSKKKSESEEDSEGSQTPKTQTYGSYERKQEEFKRKLESQVRKGLPPPRDVTTVLKVRLVEDATTVILSIWGAGEESDCDIKEGDTISVYNSFASGHRGGDLHLTANRITHIKTEPLLKLPYPSRVCTLIPDIGSFSFEPKFAEFDTVGVVVSSGSAPYGMKNFEMVNIAYPKPNNTGSAYLSVLFWNGVASFGYQGMFAPGSFVACSNLQWRRNHWSIAVAYCSERSLFTSNPRQAHLMKELRNLKALVQNPVSFAESCGEEVASELAKKPQPRSSQGTPTSWPSSDRSVSFASPADNYSPAHATLQKRLDKLSCYGSSPEMSPIVLNNTSVKVKKDFTPVTRRNT